MKKRGCWGEMEKKMREGGQSFEGQNIKEKMGNMSVLSHNERE